MKIFGAEFGVKDIREAVEWVQDFRVPKNQYKDRIGVVFAIQTEGKKGKLRLEQDIINELDETLTSANLKTKFNVIRYPEKFSKLVTSAEKAKNYLGRSRAHLIFFGSIGERNQGGENTFVCRLRGLVRHESIPEQVQSELKTDFNSSLPGRLHFAETEEILGFDVTRDVIGYTTRFISGCAAQVSNDFRLAFELLNGVRIDLENESGKGVNLNPVSSVVYQRTNARLVKVCVANINWIYERFARSRDRRILSEMVQYLEVIDLIDPDNYAARVAWSVVHYTNGNLDDAIKSISGISGGKDALWRYNLGFLYAVKGDIENALEQYRRAAHGEVDSSTCNELELFLSEEILKGGSQVPVLTFFRGLLNLKARGDQQLAKSDYESFLQFSEAKKYPRLVELAEKYLE